VPTKEVDLSRRFAKVIKGPRQEALGGFRKPRRNQIGEVDRPSVEIPINSRRPHEPVQSKVDDELTANEELP